MLKLTLLFLGPMRVVLDGESITSFRTLKVLALLAYLAATPDQAHRRETLMTLLWPGMPEVSARANLRQILFLLRQTFPDVEENGSAIPLFIANRESVRLNPQANVESDLLRFEELLVEVRTHDHLDIKTCTFCTENLAAAVELYLGDFLADFYLDDSNEFEEWAELTRQSFRRKALDALETLTTIYLRQAAYARARAFAARQLEIDNLHESAYRQLMEIMALSGERAEALALYENCRRLFSEELGMAPSARTIDLYEKIRSGDLHFDDVQLHGVRGYELKEEVGSGAYGVIHRAIQPAIQREVAIKIIHQRFANDPSFIRRFEAEAQTIARLEHPHIVPLYDYWRDSEGAFLVMRLLRGGSLLSVLQDGPWQPTRVQTLLDQIAPALDTAHRQGIIHRDIKPANILFDEDGSAYLSDFGIARDILRPELVPDQEKFLYPPDYSSPEMLLNERICPQSDIYSLGAVLYEMLTGEKPFPNLSLATLVQSHLQSPIPALSSARPDLSPELDAVIQRATAKQASDRFPTVIELADAFRSSNAGPVANKDDRIVQRSTAHIPNPYKGLRSYQEADADDFFGRESLVDRLIARLNENRFLAVVGPSGCGKSSVVKAGLLPALRLGTLPGAENWYMTEMVPGTHPLEELELALWQVAVNPPPSLVAPMERDTRGMLRTIRRILPEGEESQLLLVIDQFEELFTMVEDNSRRNHFLESLLIALNAPRSPLRVVVTLRADFFDRPLAIQPLAELFRLHTEFVLPLSREELTWAIQEPAHRVGVQLERSLVAEIVADMEGQPGALPLMQYALTELFKTRVNGTMTLRSYMAIDGVLGAMTRRADEIFTGLSFSDQKLARQLLLRLVTLGEGVEDTRRRVRLSELQQIGAAYDPKLDGQTFPPLIEQFGNARLLTFENDPATREPTVEVAHESLLKKWKRLNRWLDESREDIRLQRTLSSAAVDWENAGQDEGFLLHGAHLINYEAWFRDTSLDLTLQERTFIESSLEAQALRDEKEGERSKRELETAQQLATSETRRAVEQTQAASRLRRRAWFLAGALAISAVLGGIAGISRRTALESAAAAEQSAVLSQSLALASGALAARADDDLDLAISLAVAANQHESSPVFAQRVLYDIALGAGTIHQIVGGGGWRWTMDIFPEKYLVASGADDQNVIVWDYVTGEEIIRLEGEHTDSIGGLAFTPDGKFLLSGAYDDWLVLWDVNSGEVVRRMFNTAGDVNGLDISPNGQIAIVGSELGQATLWDLASGDQIGSLDHNPELQVLPAIFSPDGVLAATGSEDGSVIIWNVSSQTRIHTIQAFDGVVFALEFDPSGEMVAVGGSSDAIWLFDVESGQLISTLPGHPDWVFDVDFSPDGSQLIAGVRDGSWVLWDLREHQRLQSGYGRDGRTLNVAFIDFNTVISSSSTGNLRVWSLGDARIVRDFYTGDNLISFAQVGDGRLAALGSNGSISIQNQETGRIVHEIQIGEGVVTALAFNPDGALLLYAVQAGPTLSPVIDLVLLDVVSGLEIRRFEGHNNRIHRLVFSPDGQTFLSASDDRQVILWHASTGEQEFSFTGPSDTSNAVDFSPDGTRMAAGFGTFRFVAAGEYLDNSIRVWETSTGDEIARLEGHTDAVVSLVFSADGKYVLSGSIDTTVRLWDIEEKKMIREMNGHTSGVMSVAFSPDGRFAVSGSQDGTVIVWYLETGDLIRQFESHRGGVHFVSFTADGQFIWSAAEDGRVILWNPVLSIADLFAWIGANRFVPELSCDQLLLYRLVDSCEQAVEE